MSIRLEEAATYHTMFGVEQYSAHSPGEMWSKAFEVMTSVSPKARVTDFGCGSGKGAQALADLGYKIICCDLVDERSEAKHLRFYRTCLWDHQPLALNCDWGFCCDVMEHLPPTFAMLAVSRMLECCNEGLFLSICLLPDQLGAWIGKPLHKTVQLFTEWRDQLNEIGIVTDSRDCLQTGLYVVRKR